MDIEKTMEFILSVQARLEASAQKQDEQIAAQQEQIAAHNEQLARLESSLSTVTDLVGRLAQAEIRLVERMDSGFKELFELHANTQAQLNALIDTVDKLVRRNGHKE